MSDGKFYWLKMKRDFFKRHDIQILESIPNGKDYELFYLKLMFESIDHNGSLRFNDTIPYNETMLATITNTPIDTVHTAIQVLVQLEMITILDDGTYYLSEVEKLIGSSVDNDNANRQRRYREQLKVKEKQTLLQNVTPVVTKNNESKNKSKSIELDIKKEIDKEKKDVLQPSQKHLYGKYKRIKLTDEEYQRLVNDYDKTLIDTYIDKVDEYVESNNNKNHYTNFNLVIRRAIRENWFNIKVEKKENKSNAPSWLGGYMEDYENNIIKK